MVLFLFERVTAQSVRVLYILLILVLSLVFVSKIAQRLIDLLIYVICQTLHVGLEVRALDNHAFCRTEYFVYFAVFVLIYSAVCHQVLVIID